MNGSLPKRHTIANRAIQVFLSDFVIYEDLYYKVCSFANCHEYFKDTILIINEHFIHTNKLSVIFVSFGRLFFTKCVMI